MMRFLSLLATVVVFPIAAGASTITVTNGSAAPFQFIVDSGGTNVAEGSIVRVGFFETIALDKPTFATKNVSDLNADFVDLGDLNTVDADTGNGTVTIGGALGAGRITLGQIKDVSIGAGNTLKPGTQFVLWVTNFSTVEGSTEYGIFTSENAAWSAGDNSLTNTTLNPALVTVVDLKGSVDGRNLKLERIPEPSSLLLGLAGMVVLGLRRRR